MEYRTHPGTGDRIGVIGLGTGPISEATWQQADAVVTIRYPGAEDIIVKMDEWNSSDIMCGLVLFENSGDETFNAEKIVRFFPGHQALDEAFHWGLRWRAGRK